jgi:hypothetical protein
MNGLSEVETFTFHANAYEIPWWVQLILLAAIVIAVTVLILILRKKRKH